MFSDAKEEPIMYVGGGPRAGVTQVRFAIQDFRGTTKLDSTATI